MPNFQDLAKLTEGVNKTRPLRWKTTHKCHLVMLLSVTIHFALIYISAGPLQPHKLQNQPCTQESPNNLSSLVIPSLTSPWPTEPEDGKFCPMIFSIFK